MKEAQWHSNAKETRLGKPKCLSSSRRKGGGRVEEGQMRGGGEKAGRPGRRGSTPKCSWRWALRHEVNFAEIQRETGAIVLPFNNGI